MLLVVLVACGPPPAAAPAGGPAPGATVAPTPSRNAAAPAADPDHPLVTLHNNYRADHCAPPLEWSDKLAKVAQKWANHLRDEGCTFGHSSTSYGENLAAGTSGALDDATVVDMWYREVDQYDFKRGEFDMNTGHFTQLVWVGTTKIGCARSSCKGNDIVVCNYDPAGNVMTYFKQNVLPRSCQNRNR
jgi:uncharacterized protein YkwD